MELGLAVRVAIVVLLCLGCFVLIAWVWAKELEVPSGRPRRRGLSRWQLVALPLLLLITSAYAAPGLRVQDTGFLLALRVAAAVALILALFLFDQDLRLRAGDPPARHRLTRWGVASLAAVLVAVALETAEVAVATGDRVVALAGPAVLVGVAAIAWLDFLLAMTILRRL